MPSIVPLLNKINNIILNPLILFFFSLAILVFLWGIFKFILNNGDETGRAEGKQAMLWGVIGMFIMVAVFGIIRLILASFGISADVYPLN